MKEFVYEVGSDLIDTVITAARENKSQIISSVWAINEAIAVIDRKVRKEEITPIEVQTIIATFVQRINEGSQSSSFLFAPMTHQIVANSRLMINHFHVSPDDALHLYTAWIYDCEYFPVHDKDLIKQIRSGVAEGMTVIDLNNATDRTHLATQLGPSTRVK